ncbi:hypothetical protein HPB49_011832 [Dermacentor silvarum]|uniref:Uncharacterized protein n=1 Tax=Dermacentor silvarum TaxID=543639 RepID=A0ACB8CKZ7_DERSI|nr:hypothetical protein HPB49_011832 [Dermacentor silvarum]
MDCAGVPKNLVQMLLEQTEGSPTERKRLAAQVRQVLMVAPISTSSTSSAPSAEANVAASFVHAGTSGTPSTTVTMPAAVPRLEGFRHLQSPQEFLDKVENFCVAAVIPSEYCVRRVIETALDASAKLWYRFAGPFESLDAFADTFRKECASVDEKLRFKEKLDRRTQHLEENLKEFIYVVAAYYDRISEEVPESVKVDRVLRQMHPQLQALAEGSTNPNLKALTAAADSLMEEARRWLQYWPIDLHHPKQTKSRATWHNRRMAFLTQWQCLSTRRCHLCAEGARFRGHSSSETVARSSGSTYRRASITTPASTKPDGLPTMWWCRPHCTQLREWTAPGPRRLLPVRPARTLPGIALGK